jgi:hypothetical protein
MAWGSNNELMIFPIIDIVRREIKSMLRSGSITLEDIIESPQGNGSYISEDNSTEVTINGNLLTKLESNDFELTLEKNDPNRPGLLTGVIISFGDELKQVISLLRQNNKLAFVKTAIILREKAIEKIANPYGMSGGDFIEYVRNKRIWLANKAVYEDANKTESERNIAYLKMTYLETRNQELRNLYGITVDVYYTDLLKYLPNPLGMSVYDFIEYMKNARCWNSATATEAQKTEAHDANVALRAKYGILEEDAWAFTYDELKVFLLNPLGMHEDDYTDYVANRQKYITLDPNNTEDLGEINRINVDNQALLDRYYTTDTYTLEELSGYLEANTTNYEEKVLFRILVSLNYNQSGKLVGVKSETMAGS